MARKPATEYALSIGQVATRFKVSNDHVKSLIHDRELDGFLIPATGRYRQAYRVTLASVLAAEERWRINGNGEKPKRERTSRSRNGSMPQLKHFPELNDPPEPPADTDEAERS